MKIKDLIKLLQDPDYNENDEVRVRVNVSDSEIHDIGIISVSEIGVLDNPHICINLS